MIATMVQTATQRISRMRRILSLILHATVGLSVICYFGREQLIPLAQLFRYPSPTEQAPTGAARKGFNAYWKGGVANLDRELELYDLLNSQDDEGAGVATQGDTRGRTDPILVD
jgi:hypothetical protein